MYRAIVQEQNPKKQTLLLNSINVCRVAKIVIPKYILHRVTAPTVI